MIRLPYKERVMSMMELLEGLFSVGFSIISVFFVIILALVAFATAWLKGRNAYFWSIVTLFQPWVIIILFLLPRKLPKFRSYLKDKPEFQDKNPVIASIMALSAIVAKADGHVSKEEVKLVQTFITNTFRISNNDLASYQSAFDYGKDHPDEYQEFVRVIKIYHNNRNFVLSLSYLFLMIGIQGKTLSDMEESSIKRIILELGLTEYEYNSIKLYITNGGHKRAGFNSQGPFGGQRSYQGGAYGSGNPYNQASREDLVEKYTKVLGIDKNADMTEIKKAYRTLAKEYHPDKLASESMPKDYEEYAHQRILEINEAYEYLKDAKAS